MSKNRTILTTIPVPPLGFVSVLPESQIPGQYVVGQSAFVSNPDIKRPMIFTRNIGGSAEEFILGLLSIFMIMIITEIVMTILSGRRSSRKDEENEFAYAAVRVGECLRLNVGGTVRRDGWPRKVGPTARIFLTVLVLVVGMFVLMMDTIAVFLTQPHISLSKPGDYNLKAYHPIAASRGLGKFLRRTAIERPCVTPVFSQTNPSRNFSMSACTTFDLEQAHNRIADTVNTVTIGSWLHEGGGDHIVTFGNASITIKTRLFLYGVQGGTRRILFSMLYDNYLAAIRYLHELVMYGIMEESCNAKYATKTCDEILKEYQSESKPTNRTVALWTTRKGKLKETVLGLETKLFLSINKPWVAVFKNVGPLLTAEQVTEVQGPGSYSHIVTEERQENINGLLVQESRNLGVIGLILVDSILFLGLLAAKIYFQPVFLSQQAWEVFEKRHTNNEYSPDKSTDLGSSQDFSLHEVPQPSSSGTVRNPRNSGTLHVRPTGKN